MAMVPAPMGSKPSSEVRVEKIRSSQALPRVAWPGDVRPQSPCGALLCAAEGGERGVAGGGSWFLGFSKVFLGF